MDRRTDKDKMPTMTIGRHKNEKMNFFPICIHCALCSCKVSLKSIEQFRIAYKVCGVTAEKKVS